MDISRSTRAAVIAALWTAAAAAPPAQAAGDAGGEIVLRRDGSKATQVVTVPVARADRFDWGDAALGAGAGVAALMLAAAAAEATRRRHPGRAPQPARGG